MNRKLLFLLGLVLCSCLASNAQIYETDLTIHLDKNYEKIKKGSVIKVVGVQYGHLDKEVLIDDTYTNKEDDGKLSNKSTGVDAYFLLLDNNELLGVSKNMPDAFTYEIRNIQQFWDASIINHVLYNLQKKGTQSDLRNEQEEDALDYINRVHAAGIEFNDPYLESYIYSIIAKIAPQALLDGRAGCVNILILNEDTPNASMYPNGTLAMTTGLLASLHTEDELVAILSHEIAHFVLDHSIQNINEAIKRQKRAEFWAALATGLAAGVDVTLASKNRYYMPGVLTAGTALLSFSVATEINRRLGIQYNGIQDAEADGIAKRMLSFLKYDTNALASALNRIRTEQLKNRSKNNYFSQYTYSALIERINQAGTPESKSDKEFEKMMSFAVTNAAALKYESRRYRQVLPLVDQNIENGVATSDDYLLKANCFLALYNDNVKNKEVVDLVNTAKNLDPSNINIYKAEIIANLRLKANNLAQEQLNEYTRKLDQMSEELSKIVSPNTWDSTNDFITTEREWANNMMIKLRGM